MFTVVCLQILQTRVTYVQILKFYTLLNIKEHYCTLIIIVMITRLKNKFVHL